MDIAIHTNFTLPHQLKYAQHLSVGFKRHGHKTTITQDIHRAADIHVVLGPHYAKERWLEHPHVILLDRAYYRPDPINVSLGWMNSNGGRDFKIGCGRIPPIRKNKRTTGGTIFLADYNGPMERADTVRLHPSNEKPETGLIDALYGHKRAIGYKTTSLVTAGLEGLEVICRDKQNIMYKNNWIDLLPYADWSYEEIESGEAWEHLEQSL